VDDLVQLIVPFKRKVYEAVVAELGPLARPASDWLGPGDPQLRALARGPLSAAATTRSQTIVSNWFVCQSVVV